MLQSLRELVEHLLSISLDENASDAKRKLARDAYLKADELIDILEAFDAVR